MNLKLWIDISFVGSLWLLLPVGAVQTGVRKLKLFETANTTVQSW
jgi:hypothetical protein